MRVDRLPHLFNCFLPPQLLDWSLNPLGETLLQSVKSFMTVFIQYNKGLENKLTRAPLPGLAIVYIYYIIESSFQEVCGLLDVCVTSGVHEKR